MSYFKDNIAYIIVPSSDVTEEMYNNTKLYFNTDENSVRKNNDGTKCLFKVKTPISEVFNNYKWYNLNDIRAELEKSEWVTS